RNLSAWLRERGGGYDRVIVHGIWQHLSFAVWQRYAGSPIPYYVFPHGMLDPWFKKRYPLKHIKKWLYWPWAEYRVLRDAAAVVFTCEEERLLARKSFWLYKAKERVVAYGTADPVFRASQREDFLAKFPVLRGKQYLLFLSRIHRKKGCDLLLEAFAAVFKRDSELHLVMAGPDSTNWRPQLEPLARNLGIGD